MNRYKAFIIAAALVVIIQVVAGYILYYSFQNDSERSSIGSMFGIVDTLFAGLAFAGVIYAIILQRHELELQRKELELTRQELERSAAAQESSEKSLSEQVRISQRQLEAVYRPYIVIRISPADRKGVIWLTISNNGQISAGDLKLTIDRSFYARDEHGGKYDLAEAYVFNNTIPIFPPGAELSFILTGRFYMGDEINEKETPMNFNITADYSYPGSHQTENTTIDLQHYLQSSQKVDGRSEDFYLKRIEDQLKDINKSIRELKTAFSGRR
jgi:hypothetical protein